MCVILLYDVSQCQNMRNADVGLCIIPSQITHILITLISAGLNYVYKKEAVDVVGETFLTFTPNQTIFCCFILSYKKLAS